MHAGNGGKTGEFIRKTKSRSSHSAPQGRSSLPQTSLQEWQQEITISRQFMMCHSCQKLELYGDSSILQKLSAQSFHRYRPISAINLPPKVVVTMYSLMKGQV